LAHEENPRGETVNVALFSQVDFEPSCFEEYYTNEFSVQDMQEDID